VLVDHLSGIHPVDMVGPDDHHEVWPVGVDQVQRLVDRIGRAGLPLRADPLLGRHRCHPVVE
jgi:hypothetical protein